MADYVTPTGLVIPDLTTLLANVEAAQRVATGQPNLDTSLSSPVGQLNAPIFDAVRDEWEGIDEAYHAWDPNDVEDAGLDAICQVTGTFRAAATFSTLTATVNLDANKTFPAGLIFGIDGSTTQFVSIEDVSSTTAGPYPVACRCLTLGPVVCIASTLTQIVTPQAGLNSVTNAADAVLGESRDTDAQLRVRRVNELDAQGSGTIAAIRARIEQITLANGSKPVEQVSVTENDGDFPDALGRPPHSFEALIYDGDSPLVPDDTIAQTIWNAKDAGAYSYGVNGVGTATDEETGAIYRIRFSRVTVRPIKVQVSLTKTSKYAGDLAVKAAMQQAFLATRPSLDASLPRSTKALDFATIIDRGTAGGVPGVTDLPTIELGFVGGSFGGNYVNLSLGPRDMPTLDTADITIL